MMFFLTRKILLLKRRLLRMRLARRSRMSGPMFRPLLLLLCYSFSGTFGMVLELYSEMFLLVSTQI